MELMNFVLKLHDISGLNPRRPIVVMQIYTLFMAVVTFALYTCGLVESWTGIESIRNINLYPTSFIVLFKAFSTFYYRKKLSKALNLLANIWELNRYPEHEEHLKKKHKIAYITVVGYYAFINICTFGTFVLPFITWNFDRWPLEFYPICDMQTAPCYQLMYFFILYYCYAYAIPVAIGFDGLFIAFCAYCYVGVENLKNAIRKIDVEKSSEEQVLKEVSDIAHQHNAILELLKEVREVFAVPLFAYILASAGNQVVVLYMITMKGMPPKMKHFMENGNMLMAFVMQMMFFCYASSIVEEQLKSLSFEVYCVDWASKTNAKLRKNLAFIIERTQINESFTIGKLSTLNLDTFVEVLKKVFSVYTLINETGSVGAKE